MHKIIVASLYKKMLLWLVSSLHNIQDTLAKLFHTALYNTVPHYQRKQQLSTATVGGKVAADKNTINSKECTKFSKLKT